jgi:hypothetical protein
MPSDPSKAGKIGGSRNTAKQKEARRKNGFKPRPKPEQPEPAPKVAAPKYILSPSTPAPAPTVDELSQEVSDADFTA